MGSNMMELKMSDDLNSALERAASRKLTANEILEQRVSFVYGSISSKSGITKERVKQFIIEGVDEVRPVATRHHNFARANLSR